VTVALAVIVKGWPRLSETFIARELAALEARGISFAIWSLRVPGETRRHTVHGTIRAAAHYLPEYLHQEPARVLRAWWQVRGLPGAARAWAAFRADVARDRSRNRIRRFGQALVLAAELPPETRFLYAHFLHTPASVARYAAMIRGLNYGVSAHARDIWTSAAWDRAAKLATARFVTVCTEDGHARLKADGPGAPLYLNRHGIDARLFVPPPAPRPARDGRSPGDPVTILSVGRMVEKKGYPVLIEALAQLPPALAWRFVHLGSGPDLARVKDLAATRGIAARCTFRGSADDNTVLAAMQEADLFALSPQIAADGDRDGLPNVLVEAQACGLSVAATLAGGVGELIRDGENGFLSAPGDAGALAASLARLIAEPDVRARLGAAGRLLVERDFADAPGHDAIARLLTEALRGP
jgi:glycosyltransferase involved in cell wall biosynthesis